MLDWVRSGKLRKVYVGEHLLRIPASALDDLVNQAV
ncbi:Uncharacterised protein [Mycobacteroides abscessus subsp. massiliense]|nr:Uncharacterised protein [Mycobacteroides abscessus subsp. massiliense]SKL85051.1 Uncharacterised protein [Mycobacteroides abscessus subsp. massiliense]